MEDVELFDEMDRRGWFGLHGLGADLIACRVASTIGAASSRFDVFGVEGALMSVPNAVREGCITAFAVQGVCVLDDVAWNDWRVRHGFVAFGTDYDTGDRPHEAAL